MSIEEIKSIIEDKSIALGAEKLRNPDARYMWVVSMSVFDKVRSYCELDKATMDKLEQVFDIVDGIDMNVVQELVDKMAS